MPPRLVFSSVCRSLAIRTRPSIRPPQIIRIAARRGFADGDRKPENNRSQNALGSVSEEAAQISKVTGGAGPELGQGTPVQDVSLSIAPNVECRGTIYPGSSLSY